MTHASLFSGIGGPEIAATMLGWDNVFHCEINPFGRRVLDYWFPNSESYEDITKTEFTKWRGKVDVLTGGFPCQPFSYAGKRRGADDDRYLWPYMFKAIYQIRPTWVVAENVAGITTMVEQGEVAEMGCQASMFEEVDGLRRYRLTETFTLQRICDDLEGHGYSVQPVLVPACAVGAPHRRDRVFIVARRKDTSYTEVKQGGCLQSLQSEDCGETQEQYGGRGEEDGDQRNNADTVRLETERRVATDVESYRTRGATRSAGESSERPNGQSDEQPPVGCRFWNVGPDDSRIVENGITGQQRWRNFPTVSPVHRGNDGIPFSLDRLSIPFAKWRTESLKAYGNAIVPQVMYEIFRSIALVEKKTNKNKKL